MASELKPCRRCGIPFKGARREQVYCSRSCASSVRLHRRDLLEGIATQSRLDASGCWSWTGNVNEHGYGRMNLGGAPERAHRVAYRLFVGLIPEGMTIDHLCRNRACVNPQHMEVVTRGENVRRGFEARGYPQCRK